MYVYSVCWWSVPPEIVAATCGQVIYYNYTNDLKTCLLYKDKLLSHQVFIIVLVNYWCFHSHHKYLLSNPKLQEKKAAYESTKITDEKAALKPYLSQEGWEDWEAWLWNYQIGVHIELKKIDIYCQFISYLNLQPFLS